MIIQNKLEKFLAVLSSIFLMAIVVLGLKIKDDSKKMDKLENNLNDYNAGIANVLETQKQIMDNRQTTLDKIANAPAPDTTKTVTTQTVVPGKTVTQKVPVSSSKTTKSS